MAFIDSIYEKAKQNPGRVVVPECNNPSMMRSCVRAAADGLAEIIFVGDAQNCWKVAAENGIDLGGVAIVDSNDLAYQQELLEKYAALPAQAFSAKSVEKRMKKSPLYLALVMEAVGEADCTFGGLDTTTMEFVMAAQGTLGLKPGVKASSGMLIKIGRAHV